MSIKNIIPQKIKNIYHIGQAVLANFVYGFSGRKIKIIGVTGTNGKTTTVWMIGKILEEAGHKVAINSTINFKIGAKEWANKTKFTTLSSFAAQKFIQEAVKEGCNYLVLETSSHSLDQFRVWGIPYAVAVITNVTREHLDYHQTMEKYRKAKSILFKNLKSNFQFSIHNFQSIFNDKNLEKDKKVSIVNLDMENPGEFLNFAADERYGYSVKSTKHDAQKTNRSQITKYKFEKVVAENVELGINNSKFTIHNSQFFIHLSGLFNIENALAATCVGLSQNIDLETIKKTLEKIQGIPGRMEYVPNNKNLNIIIDYAVTPDSLEKLYALINQIKNSLPLEKPACPVGRGDVRRTKGFEKQSENFKSSPNPSLSKGGEHKIIAVFGACGERDRGKRPIMGAIVARYADYAIVTNEDPYGENEVDIINQVFSGVVGIRINSELPNYQLPITNFQSNPKSNPPAGGLQTTNYKLQTKFTEGANCLRILDRREAIRIALKLAQSGDFVIVTGKGAEEIMVIGKERIPWKEKTVIEEELAKL